MFLQNLTQISIVDRKSKANKANPKDIIPLREVLNMEIMINQALIDILVTKGIITQEELMLKKIISGGQTDADAPYRENFSHGTELFFNLRNIALSAMIGS